MRAQIYFGKFQMGVRSLNFTHISMPVGNVSKRVNHRYRKLERPWIES